MVSDGVGMGVGGGCCRSEWWVMLGMGWAWLGTVVCGRVVGGGEMGSVMTDFQLVSFNVIR